LSGTNPAVILDLDTNLGTDLILGNDNNSGTVVFRGALRGHAVTSFGNVTKIGPGTQWLAGTNTYSGATTITSGLLGISTLHTGNGTFTVADGAGFGITNVVVTVTNAAATNLVTVSAAVSSLTLGAGGATTFQCQNLTNAGTATSLVNCSGALTVNGVCTITIVGTNGLVPGQQYPLVTAASLGGSGNFALSLPPGISGNLVTNSGPTIALAIPSGPPRIPTNLVFSVSGSTLTLSWPANYLGWYLQAQTNSLSSGLGTNWVTIPGTELVTSYTNTIDTTKGTVFYRLDLP